MFEIGSRIAVHDRVGYRVLSVSVLGNSSSLSNLGLIFGFGVALRLSIFR